MKTLIVNYDSKKKILKVKSGKKIYLFKEITADTIYKRFMSAITAFSHNYNDK